MAVAGALLFHLSPVMLVQGPLPMSDPPALMFIALALAAASVAPRGKGGRGEPPSALGAAASAAIGCRPQLALAVLPMLAVALWQAPGWRRRGAGRWPPSPSSRSSGSSPWSSATGGLQRLPRLPGQAGRLRGGARRRRARGPAARSACSPRSSSPTPGGPSWRGRYPCSRWPARARLVRFRRSSAAPPLAVLAGVHLAFCLLVMDPADGVRYALPAVLGVAFAAAAVRRRRAWRGGARRPAWAAHRARCSPRRPPTPGP